MTQLIPEQYIDELLQRADIVEIISEYVSLKQKGRSFKACCPFHDEKTPSFVVSPDKQIFHCFGCNVGGDAIAFVMKYEKITFPEAVEMLSQKYGLTMPEKPREFSNSKTASLVARVFSVNQKAMEYYKKILESDPMGQVGREYLQQRGIDSEISSLLCLGFAPSGWEHLTHHCNNDSSIDYVLLEKSGLSVRSERGTFYDRFRARLIFPIFDNKNRVLGFGGRTVDENEVKYINSPESAIYTKGKQLYGLNFAKEAIVQQKRVIIVEGYMDFLRVFQAGFKNVVASLGTALTKDQLKLLKRYADEVVILYDGDAAGQIATLRNLDIALQESFRVRIVDLPDGEDPDSFIMHQGKGALEKKLNEAKGLLEYKLAFLLTQYSMDRIDQKSLIIREMLTTVKNVQNLVEQSEYIKLISEKLSVDQKALISEMTRSKSTERKYRNFAKKEEFNDTIEQPRSAQRLLVGCMLESRNVVEQIRQSLRPEDFNEPGLQKIVAATFQMYEQGKTEITPLKLINYFRDEDIKNLITVITANMDGVINHEQTLKDCLKKVRIDKFKMQLHILQSKMKNDNDTTIQMQSVVEYSKLLKEYQVLKNKI